MNPNSNIRNRKNPDSADQGQLPKRDHSGVEDVPAKAQRPPHSDDSLPDPDDDEEFEGDEEDVDDASGEEDEELEN